MLEISVCQSILKAVVEEFPEVQMDQIREIHLKAGILNCLEPHILQKLFKKMIKGTDLEYAALIVEQPPVVADCDVCGSQFPAVHNVFNCLHCGSSSTTIISGNELEINKIIIEEYSCHYPRPLGERP
jgi:hydrogenase nickel incorporation protein HypA/HybF